MAEKVRGGRCNPWGSREQICDANLRETALEIIELQSGGYLGEDDIVRFGDQYGRVRALAD